MIGSWPLDNTELRITACSKFLIAVLTSIKMCRVNWLYSAKI